MRKFLALFLGIMLFVPTLTSCEAQADVYISKELYDSQVSSSHETERIPVVINKNSGNYHLKTDCVYAARMSDENRLILTVPDEDYLLSHGYTPCKYCSDTETPT